MRNRFLFAAGLLALGMTAQPGWGQVVGKQPVTVNGDTVEFMAQGREIVAEGHVEVLHQDARMSCDRVRVFLEEKIVIAEGHVKFSRPGGESFEGSMVTYDFGDQTGTVVGSYIRMAPYFAKAELMEKISPTQFTLYDAEMSTCDLEHPHYCLKSEEITMNPGQMVTAKGVKLSILDVPVFYLPKYSQRMSDSRPRFMITPGHTKDFGSVLLGSYRYYLNDQALGRLHLGWYERKGWAQGADLHYNTRRVGVDNMKYYHIHENDPEEGIPDDRYRAELRHKWDITGNDRAMVEFYKESDAEFRKDYFYREYVREISPSSYFLGAHAFPQATLSMMVEPRVNRFDDVLQKLPEVNLGTVEQRIKDSPFYFKDSTSLAYLSDATANESPTEDVGRLGSSNELSYLFQFADIDFSPFAGYDSTYYTRGVDADKDYMQGQFFTGLGMSSKLFRVYDVETDFLNLDVNKLRHIITPSVSYRYQTEPMTDPTDLLDLDETEDVWGGQRVIFGLQNKLQTKREEKSVDLVTLLLNMNYHIDRIDGSQGFQDFEYDLEFKPYSWWEFDSDGDFDIQSGFFKDIHADLWGTMGQVQASVGYQFEKDQESQITTGFIAPLNPFWKFSIYDRFDLKTGDLEEQEYRLSRDMHCWFLDFIINNREDNGVAFLVAFKLKAFPDVGVNAEHSFATPRTND